MRGGEIVRGDPFSWTMPGYEFGNYFFLYQITVSFLFNKLGYILTAILFGILVSAGVLLLLPKTLSFWKVLAGALGVVLASFSLGIRPSTVSFGLFSLLLVFLERRFFSSRMSILVWFVFFAVWANFHQGFIVGLFVLTIFLVIDFFWQKQKTKDEILATIDSLQKKSEDKKKAIEEEKKANTIEGLKKNRMASWGTQIRSYVLHPYKMVKDHRSGVETQNAEGVLDGDLDAFVEGYLKGQVVSKAKSS